VSIAKELSRLVLVGLAISRLACAQAPFIQAGSIVNGASFRPAAAPNTSVAPGSIVSIFGVRLATETLFATVLPLPNTIGGTSVTIGGIAAPLFFVSLGQINAQVPWNVPSGNQPVLVKTSAGSSSSVNVTVTNTAPGIFSLASNGSGQGVIQNFVAQDNTPLNGLSNAASSGGIIIIYATGLGPVTNSPASGEPGSAQTTVNHVAVTVGGKNAVVDFAGLSPGFVGLYQINARVPPETPEGCFLPVAVTVAGQMSNAVTVSKADSGNCNTANTGTFAVRANQSIGTALLVRTATVGASVTGTVQGRFLKYPANLLWATSGTPPAGAGCVTEIRRGLIQVNPPVVPGGRPLFTDSPTLLRPGILTLTSPSGEENLLFRDSSGVYGTLGDISIGPGVWKLAATASADIGSFNSSMTIPAPLSVNSYSISGSTLSQSQPLSITWTSPDPEGLVAVEIQSSDTTQGLFGLALCTAVSGDGQITIDIDTLRQLPASTGGNAQIAAYFSPNAKRTGMFTASGLDLGILLYADIIIYKNLTMNP